MDKNISGEPFHHHAGQLRVRSGFRGAKRGHGGRPGSRLRLLPTYVDPLISTTYRFLLIPPTKSTRHPCQLCLPQLLVLQTWHGISTHTRQIRPIHRKSPPRPKSLAPNPPPQHYYFAFVIYQSAKGTQPPSALIPYRCLIRRVYPSPSPNHPGREMADERREKRLRRDRDLHVYGAGFFSVCVIIDGEVYVLLFVVGDL